jgi:hypothetical protein
MVHRQQQRGLRHEDLGRRGRCDQCVPAPMPSLGQPSRVLQLAFRTRRRGRHWLRLRPSEPAELIRRGFELTGVDDTPTMLPLLQRSPLDTRAHLMNMPQLNLNRRFRSARLRQPLSSRLPIHPPSSHDPKIMLRRAALLFTSGNEEGTAVGEPEADPLDHGSLRAGAYRTSLHTTDRSARSRHCGFKLRLKGLPPSTLDVRDLFVSEAGLFVVQKS